MSKLNNYNLQIRACLDVDTAIQIIVTLKQKALTKYETLTLSQIIPDPVWQTLNKVQKGYIGLIFSDIHEALGFEYVGKGKYGTTNMYRLVKNVEL
jgi:hypothetical protein